MKKLTISLAVVAVAVAGPVGAHPTDVVYETRGECEAVFAASSKLDRERLVELGLVPNNGAAQKTFNETFSCEYDDSEEAWFIVFHGFPQG